MASSGELKGASRIAHTSCAIATQAVTALSAPVQHGIIKVPVTPMFLMNKWFELPYAQEARTWHIPKLWLLRSAFTPRNISWARHDVAG